MTTQSGPPQDGAGRAPAGPPSGSPAGASAPFAAMLRGALLPTLVLDVLVVAGTWVMAGAGAAGASALGAGVVTVFFAAGLAVMARLAGTQPITFLAAAMAVYLGQILFLAVVIIALSGATWLDGRAFALSALVVAVGWQVFQIVAFLRMRKPVYDATGPARAREHGA